MHPVSITVSPPSFRSRLDWLLSHLEKAYPVTFVAAEIGRQGDCAGAIVFQDGEVPLPVVRGSAIVYALDLPSTPAAQSITFTADPAVDRRLQGRLLVERSLGPLRPLSIPGSSALATCSGAPVWVRSVSAEGQTDIVRLPGLEGLSPTMLWDNLQEHRFFFLLTLVHYLRPILADSGWVPPPLRAAFVVDDPNLRTTEYGGFGFADVARAARENRFHVSVAIPPIDFPVTSRKVAGLVGRNPDVLSLSIHGNNHPRQELLRVSDEAEALATACQMLRRVERFEQQYHVPVSRVVVPPYELCSREALRAFCRLPFDAVVTTRPFPWLPPDTWMEGGGSGDALLCWLPGDFVAGGMPVIRRSSIPNNMVFRAFLDQPVIRYFHHAQFSGPMEEPLRAAAEINAMGDVQWVSLEEIALSNFEIRRSGTSMTIRPYSRRIHVPVPGGTEAVRIDLPDGVGEGDSCTINGVPVAWSGDGAPPMQVEPGSTLEVRLVRGDAVDHRVIPDLVLPPFRALLHRRASELIDRLHLR
jgi:hypothetical protein